MSVYLSDPLHSSVLVASVQWIEGTLLGTLATTVAVIAIAAVGYMMLAGRVDYKRGATVIGGCFLLFGAAGIAGGLRSLTEASFTGFPPYVIQEALPAPSPVVIPPDMPVYDPYAGAAAPVG